MRVVRHDAAHAVDAVGRRARDVRQRTVQVQLDVPVGELDLVGVVNAVEVGVVPHAPIDQADAGDAADVDRHTGARLLRRIVPIDRSRVRHARADGKIRVQRGAEPERHRATRRERPIDGRVVAREQGAGDDDAVRRAVERRRACDVGETARSRVEVVADHDVVRRHGADVGRLHDVLEHRARERRSTADDGDVLGDAQLLHVADDDDRRLGSRRRIAVAVGRQTRQLRREDRGLVRDQRARRHAVVDA